MSKDRSLTDFTDEIESSASNSPSESGEEPKATGSAEAVGPATPTYRFAPDGAACEHCGETVERRWHDDGQFVCAACKDW